MIFHYLDSSAWVKRYYQEAGTAWVQGLFEQQQRTACASLGLVEVTATLARKHKARDLTSAQLEQKLGQLNEDWTQFVRIQLTAEAITIACDVATRFALRGADAIHLASALLLQRRFAEADDRLILVTSDRELKEAAQSSGLPVIDPEQAGAVADQQ